MKKLYFAVLGFCCWHGMNGQGLHIPDSNFKSKLLSASTSNKVAKNLEGEFVSIDGNNNGEIEASEASAVAYLNIASSSIADLSGIEYFTALKYLACNDNELMSLDVSSSPDLEYLYCSTNVLTQLNLSGCNRLRDLECNHNRLTSLDVSGKASLRDLKCDTNELTSLLLTGSPIKELHCGYNLLVQLDLSGQTALESLNCSNNRLAALDLSGLASLERLLAQNNRLITISDLVGFRYLKSVQAGNNRLRSLVVSCPLLSELGVQDNQLESLKAYGCPALGLGERGLNFRNNPLALLDVRGYEGLTSIACNNYGLTGALTVMADPTVSSILFNDNRLTSLDVSQCLGAEVLSFKSNPQLATLFIKNGKNNHSSVAMALPTVPRLRYICADEGAETTQLQHLIAATAGRQCEVNSYCSFAPGGRYYAVESVTAFDNDNNGCEANDPGFPFAGYKVVNGTTETIYLSDRTGKYNLPLQSGNSVITPLLADASYFMVTPPSASVTFPSQNNSQNPHFCVSPKGKYADLEIVMLPLGDAIPGYASSYKIMYRNKGTVVQSGSIGLQFDAPVLRLGVSVPQAVQERPDRLSWTFSELMPLEMRTIVLSFTLNAPTDSPALNANDVLKYTASITTPALDASPEDNVISLRQKVTNSFDPNDKTCLQGDRVSTEYIGQYVHYIVRFENTGTAIAKNIIVKDIIDTDRFDMRSLEPIESSHPFTTKISNGNTVEFVFKDIDLPFYNDFNDGYVAFKIKIKPSLAVGDTFSNSASIYFDYNLPILTDRIVTTIESLGTPGIDLSDRFSIYPNPSKGLLYLENKENMVLKSISIYNMMGQPVLVISNAAAAKSVDISDLASGSYVMKIYSEQGSAVGKFVKE